MARGNLRRVRERNGSHIITIPSAFVAQLGLKKGTMMQIEVVCGPQTIKVSRNCLVMAVLGGDDDG